MNVYEKLFDPLGFGWDTSISSFLSLVGYPHNLKLPYVEVTGNKIHTMLYENALEIFINKHANEQHLTYESFINSFKLYLLNWGTVNKNLKKNNLLYYEVTFKPLNFEFSPTWGLHECSFLNETDAINTKILYEKEQKLKERFKKIKSDLEIHQSKIREYTN